MVGFSSGSRFPGIVMKVSDAEQESDLARDTLKALIFLEIEHEDRRGSRLHLTGFLGL